MSRATIYDNDETREDEVNPIEVIKAHIPSMSDEDMLAIEDLVSKWRWFDEDIEAADLAIRTCSCGERIDGFYQYTDHLIAMFGGESHIGG